MITGVIKNQEQKTFKQSIEGIKEAVRLDTYDDDQILPRYYYYEKGTLTLIRVNGKETNKVIKTTGKLEARGYILVDINGKIIIDYLCDKDYCGYNTENNSNIIVIANENINTNLNIDTPILTLKGESKITLNINDRYIEKGVTAKTKVGEDLSNYVKTTITKNDTIVNSINTKEEGTYLITYTVTYKEETVSLSRTVEVKEEIPIITITEANSNYVKEQTIHIKVSPVGENIINNFIYTINGKNEKTVTGTSTNLTLNETGEYVIEVDVVDNHGHRNKLTSDTYKIDTTAPVIKVPTTTEVKVTEVGGYNPLENVEITDNVEVKEIIVIGSLTATIGIQSIEIKAVDSIGNTTTVTRFIEVIMAEGPILNLSTVRTEGWVKNITITATSTSERNISTFTYEIIKDNISLGIQNGAITGNSGTIDINLTETGIYQIKLASIDELGNISNLTSGEYKIDNTSPVLSEIVNSSNGEWAKSITLNWDITEEESGIKKVQFSPDNETWGDLGSNEWYGLTRNNHRDNVIYFRVIDNTGNISNVEVATMKIDRNAPSSATIAVQSKSGNASGAVVNLTVTGNDTNSGIAKYVVYYGTSSTSLPYSKTVNTTSENTTIQISEILGGVIRYFKVVAYDAVGNTKTSDVISTRTYFKTYFESTAPASVTYTSSGITLSIPTQSVTSTFSWAGINSWMPIETGDTITITYNSTNPGAYLLARLYRNTATSDGNNILKYQYVVSGTNTLTYTYVEGDDPTGFTFEMAALNASNSNYTGSITITSIKVNNEQIYPS